MKKTIWKAEQHVDERSTPVVYCSGERPAAAYLWRHFQSASRSLRRVRSLHTSSPAYDRYSSKSHCVWPKRFASRSVCHRDRDGSLTQSSTRKHLNRMHANDEIAEMNFKKIIISFYFSPSYPPLSNTRSAIRGPLDPPLCDPHSVHHLLAPHSLIHCLATPTDATKWALEVAFIERRLPALASTERTEPNATARAGRSLPADSGWWTHRA